MLAVLLAVNAGAQPDARASYQLHGHVVDAVGLPVPFANITIDVVGGKRNLRADSSGGFSLQLDAPADVVMEATADRMESAPFQLAAGPGTAEIELVVRASAVQQSVSVTTTRSSLSLGPSSNTVSVLTTSDLIQYPALTLDERLRQHAGFELFRRSSSWVANPTSEGISLRGLGSTAASRTLVLADGVPLNDGFGGWIHWNELPPETIDAVAIASGGGSDLYGSSALGGVIDILPAHPDSLLADVDLSEAAENTNSFDARVDGHHSRWDALAAGQSFRTDGYTVIAPQERGTVDVPSNVHFQNGRLEVDRELPRQGRAFLTGNLLNEARGNGTRLQTNGTRLWRYILGDDWTAGTRTSGRIRAFGSNEAYRQSFSAINPAHTSERLTRLQNVETQEFGASADAAFHLTHFAFVAGGDLRDLRATDRETPYSNGSPSGLQDTSARQRFYGGFGELLATYGGWSGAASLRVDQASNLDRSTTSAASVRTVNSFPDRSEPVFSPRVGIVRQLRHGIELHASGLRAFRSPTMNELYRTGQVGQETTLANPYLLSERATEAEGGLSWQTLSGRAHLRGAYFWTDINRPVSAVLLSSTSSTITNRRENLGQIQSQGTELNAELTVVRDLTASVGYQYAHAVVTAFSAQTTLVGLWIPEVPRNSATAQLRYQDRTTSVTLAARESGRAFDDSSNRFALHSFFVLDAYASHRLGNHASLFLSVQNLLDRQIENARTPRLTLASPFIAQGGVRLTLGGR